MLKFDLVQEQWKCVDTIWNSRESWPYTGKIADDYCMEVYEDKLYIFSGRDSYSYSSLGTNLHMCLDLKTLIWTKLGGTSDPRKLIKGMPLFRQGAGSWVIPEEKRMYVLYGYAARPKTEEHKDRVDYQYTDLWSYHFTERSWKRERLRGNFPAPRSKMTCVYHPLLHSVIVFGGCNVRMPTNKSQFAGVDLGFTNFADTFILNMKTRIWKQVLTHNIPHHRVYSQAHVDLATGNIYLYGGNSHLIVSYIVLLISPSLLAILTGGCMSVLLPLKRADKEKKDVAVGDLWQLKLDLPGHDFDRIEFDRESEIGSFGPWKLCFCCKEYKINMMKCGGTCGGSIYLCSAECQRKSWTEHKHAHRCRKF